MPGRIPEIIRLKSVIERYIDMTREERRIINGLLNRDNKITKVFFFTKCRPMFHGMIHKVFRDNADFEELVNDFYLYLMEKDGKRLRSFGKNDTEDNEQDTAYALIKWMNTTALRFFSKIAQKEQDIEEQKIIGKDKNGEAVEIDVKDEGCKDPSIGIDADIYFNMITLERDREVLKKYFLEGLEPDDISEQLGVSKANLYNIKNRALSRLQQAARHATSAESLCSIICEQYVLDVFEIHKSLEELQSLSEEKGWLTKTGVTLENIGTLCRESGLSVISKSGGTLEDIGSALEEGRQVIIAVDGGELTGNPLEEGIEDALGCQVSDHCVVVLAVEENSVTLYDPAFGTMPLTVSKEHLIDAWADSGRYYVTISQPKSQN